MTSTRLLGRLLAEAAREQLERFDVFAGLPYHPFPGGRAFRVPLSVLGSWYYAMRDRLGAWPPPPSGVRHNHCDACGSVLT